MWNNVQRSDWQSDRVRTRWWYVQAEGRHISTARGTGGTKMLRCFEQETAGLSEAQVPTRGTVPVLPSETEVEQQASRIDTPTIVIFGVGTAYVPRAKKAHTMGRDLPVCRSLQRTSCSRVRMERQSLS